MPKFDYSFFNNGLLPANLINLTSGIASLKTMAGVRKAEYAKVFTALEPAAKVQSVKSSNAIEGIVTSNERIAAIVNQDSAPLNHNEGEIAGYRDALNAIHLHYDNLDFRETDILKLHETMMQIVGYEYGGQYKTEDNYIIEEDKNGNRKVRFKPTPATEVKEAMEQLELAYMEARNDAGKYVSFEEQINNYKAFYYEALRESSIGWHENQNTYIPFIGNFLSTLYMCYKELDKRFAVVNGSQSNNGGSGIKWYGQERFSQLRGSLVTLRWSVQTPFHQSFYLYTSKNLWEITTFSAKPCKAEFNLHIYLS